MRHTRKGDKFVTVIIDLTPIRDGTGASRLLDMVEGRSKAVFKTWLDDQTAAFRDGIEVVAMDGFTGFKTAAAETVPDAVAVMDPFHVAALPATHWTAADNASNDRPADTAAAPVTRSTASDESCAPVSTCSPTSRRRGSAQPSTTMPTSRSKPPGSTTSASSPPTATPTAPPRKQP